MIKKWGTYPWFVEQGIELIHPEDLEDFKKEANNCKVFKCIEKSEYLLIEYNNNCYRVKEDLFNLMPNPKFDFGQIVKIKDKEAIIMDIMWHFNRHEHYYFVSINNKRKSKKYFETELI